MNYEDSVISGLSQKVQQNVSLIETVKRLGGRIENNNGLLTTECPFHYPRGSVTVKLDAGNNRFECSDCGFRGSVIAWVMYSQGIDFIEATASLAQECGLEWDSTVVDEHLLVARKKRDRLLAKLVGEYQANLKEVPEALSYATTERNLSEDSIAVFGIGWCKKEISNSTPMNRALWRYGVLGRMQSGHYFNKFANRITFPIRDVDGRIRGFGGRSMSSDDKGPKYLNSNASHYFQKQDLLYGLYETLQKSTTPEKMILVEGYMDVVALHQSGFQYAVAPLGTAINSIQIYNALLYTEHLSICFDIDNAGSAATLEAICKSFEVTDAGQTLDVVTMPDGYDPDKYITEYGSEAFKVLLNEALPAEHWLASHALVVAAGSRRTSRSDGSRGDNADKSTAEVSTKARVGKYIQELCTSIDSDSVKRRFISCVESLIGTKL